MQEININKQQFYIIPIIFSEKITIKELKRVIEIVYVSGRAKLKQQNRKRVIILFFCQRRMAFINETLSTTVIVGKRWL